jgi:hypothetical protein
MASDESASRRKVRQVRHFLQSTSEARLTLLLWEEGRANALREDDAVDQSQRRSAGRILYDDGNFSQ